MNNEYLINTSFIKTGQCKFRIITALQALWRICVYCTYIGVWQSSHTVSTSHFHFSAPLPIFTSHIQLLLSLATFTFHFYFQLSLPTCTSYFHCPLVLPTITAHLYFLLSLPTCTSYFHCPLVLPTFTAHLYFLLSLPTCTSYFHCPLSLFYFHFPPSVQRFPLHLINLKLCTRRI